MDKNGDTFGFGAGADALNHLNTAAVGHGQIQDDHIRTEAGGELEAGAAVGGGKHLEALKEERLSEQLQQSGFVFDNQDRLDLLAGGGAGSAKRVTEPGSGQRFRHSLPDEQGEAGLSFGIDGENDGGDSSWNPGAQFAQLVPGMLPGDLVVDDDRVRPVAFEPRGQVLKVGDGGNAVTHTGQMAAGQTLAWL